MSPGTNSFAGTTVTSPFLITFDAWSVSFCNASNDFSAFASCDTPIIAFTNTTNKIITVSVIPSPSATPTTPDTIAAIINTIIEKSLNCSKNFLNKLFFFCAFNSFSPYFSCLDFTSSVFKPFSICVSSSFSTSLIFLLNQLLFSIFKSTPFLKSLGYLLCSFLLTFNFYSFILFINFFINNILCSGYKNYCSFKIKKTLKRLVVSF